MKPPGIRARNAALANLSAPKLNVGATIGKVRRIKKELDLLALDIATALMHVQQTTTRQKALQDIRSGVVAASSFLELPEG